MVFILFCSCWVFMVPLVCAPMALIPADGTLVFKNGKKMAYQGTYSVDDKFVSFKTSKGQLYKVPLQLVDLDATARQIQKPQKGTSKPKSPKPEKEKSLAEMMGLVDDGAKPRNIEIKTDKVEGYVDKETLDTRKQEQVRQKWESSNRPSDDHMDALRKYYRDNIHNLKKREIEFIKTLANEKKELQHLNRTIPHDSLSDLDEVERQRQHERRIDDQETKVANLKNQIATVRKRIKELSKEAKEKGVKIR